MTDDRFLSYAQNLEDVLLWRALGPAVGEAGFYIDVGAADPTLLSVTRAFSERGWRGVNIEPLPEQARRLRAARPRDVTVQAALAEAPGRRRFHRVRQAGQTGLSTLDAAEAERHRAAGREVESLEVPVTTLAAVCAEHVPGPVHFLKIDVEGAEAAVLAGADFASVRPWIIVIEATQPLGAEGEAPEPTQQAWEPGLLAAGYRFVWFDGLNRFYVAEEQAGLAAQFRVPPNVFDHYRVFDPVLQEALEGAEGLALARLELLEAREQLAAAEARMRAPAEAASVAAPAHAVPAPPGIVLPAMPAWLGRMGALAWRGLRPVARPLLWRIRQFMAADVRTELAALQQQHAHMLQLVADMRAAPPPAPPPAVDPALTQSLERALLTLTLEDARNPAPPGLGPREPHPDGLPSPRPLR